MIMIIIMVLIITDALIIFPELQFMSESCSKNKVCNTVLMSFSITEWKKMEWNCFVLTF